MPTTSLHGETYQSALHRRFAEEAALIQDDTCPTCLGCGEGSYDGSSCTRCKGKGVIQQKDDDFEPPDYEDWERT